MFDTWHSRNEANAINLTAMPFYHLHAQSVCSPKTDNSMRQGNRQQCNCYLCLHADFNQLFVIKIQRLVCKIISYNKHHCMLKGKSIMYINKAKEHISTDTLWLKHNYQYEPSE